MPDTQSRYAPDATAASLSALVELATALGAYREEIILVGGWVPYFLIQENPQAPSHIGSLDIDLALNNRTIQEPRYQAILQILEQRGYRNKGPQSPFSFTKGVLTANGIPV